MLQEITERDKHINFIDEVRQFVSIYREMIKTGNALVERWESLYNTDIQEDDISIQVVSDGTSRLSAFSAAIGNIQTICTDFDNGIDTNFERVSS